MSPGGDQDWRHRILGLIERYPAIHQRELARLAGTSIASVQYHVEALARDGLVRTYDDGNLQRLLPAAADRRLSAKDRRTIAILRRPQALRLVLTLLDAGPLLHGELAVRAGMPKSNVSHHLKILMEGGVVRRNQHGALELADRADVVDLLMRYQPSPNAVDRLAQLWSAFYDSAGRR